MTFESFLETIRPGGSPPAGAAPELAALWHTRAGDWHRAHEIAQEIPTATGSWIHGLLHAIEGDFGNSAYWYRSAGKVPIRKDQVEGEWEHIVRTLLT